MNCINLCEVLSDKLLDKGIFTELLQISSAEEERRLYIGSYFCSQYFLKINFISRLSQQLKDGRIKATLVVPIFTEKDLEAGKEKIRSILEQLDGIVDEVTVNDIGMYCYVQQLPFNCGINLGRLFFKYPRDARVPQYTQTDSCVELTHLRYLPDGKHPILYSEIDQITRSISIRGASSNQVAVHDPLCYTTCGDICKYASVPKELSRKFRPNAPCHMECNSICERYVRKNPDGDVEICRIGRAVYYKVEQLSEIDPKPGRYIYFPYQEILECLRKGTRNENTGSSQ